MIAEIEDYFAKGCGRCARFDTADCATRHWAAGLAALRRICLAAGLSEHVKWGHPCYMHAGRNIALIGAFRGDFRLSFFDAALMRDPEGILEPQGPNARHAGTIRFTDTARPEAMAAGQAPETAGRERYRKPRAALKPPAWTRRRAPEPQTATEPRKRDPKRSGLPN